jgi:hypothetical protein
MLLIVCGLGSKRCYNNKFWNWQIRDVAMQTEFVSIEIGHGTLCHRLGVVIMQAMTPSRPSKWQAAGEGLAFTDMLPRAKPSSSALSRPLVTVSPSVGGSQSGRRSATGTIFDYGSCAPSSFFHHTLLLARS